MKQKCTLPSLISSSILRKPPLPLASTRILTDFGAYPYTTLWKKKKKKKKKRREKKKKRGYEQPKKKRIFFFLKKKNGKKKIIEIKKKMDMLLAANIYHLGERTRDLPIQIRLVVLHLVQNLHQLSIANIGARHSSTKLSPRDRTFILLYIPSSFHSNFPHRSSLAPV